MSSTNIQDTLQLPNRVHNLEFEDFAQVLPKLKDEHSLCQTEIVEQLKVIGGETAKLVSSLTEIEEQITQYHGEIDQWTNKMNSLSNESEQIKHKFEIFSKKLENIDRLGKEIKNKSRK